VLFQGRSRPVIGLDITTSSIKLIELTKVGDGYRVESYSAEPSPPNAINEKAIVDSQAVGEAVRRAVKRAGARSKECAVAISGDAAITKVIQMPRNLREAELESQVEMQADQYIPFPMDEVAYDFEVLGADYLVVSAHKLGGPKGAGALVVRPGAPFEPLFRGSGHERGRRGGTENVPGIVGFGLAAELAAREQRAEAVRLLALRDALNHYLPQSIAIAPVRGGTTYWVRGPSGLSVDDLAREAEARGVLVEPVDRYFATGVPPEPVFRLGVTGIPAARIRDGIAILAEVIRELSAGNLPQVDPRAPGWPTPGELRRLMPGATLLCKTVYGEPCTIELSSDGRLTGRAGYANEDRDEGRWWIEDDRWCRQWNTWSYGEVARFRTRLEGERIQWFNDAGRLVDSAVFVPRLVA